MVFWSEVGNIERRGCYTGVIRMALEIDELQLRRFEALFDPLDEVPKLTCVSRCLAGIELFQYPGKQSSKAPTFGGQIQQALISLLLYPRLGLVHFESPDDLFCHNNTPAPRRASEMILACTCRDSRCVDKRIIDGGSRQLVSALFSRVEIFLRFLSIAARLVISAQSATHSPSLLVLRFPARRDRGLRIGVRRRAFSAGRCVQCVGLSCVPRARLRSSGAGTVYCAPGVDRGPFPLWCYPNTGSCYLDVLPVSSQRRRFIRRPGAG